MSIVSIFLVFLMVWMIIFFMSLPIGISVSRDSELGNANSAPTKTHLKLKILLCTIISIAPTYLIYWLVKTEYLFLIIQNFEL
ncbi:DUF1467 family protein [Alphaproteobacteria bacterium]|nr:DUF1467 family protein [Alphaproteobacteria bacterium]